jgi:hypothetical protein
MAQRKKAFKTTIVRDGSLCFIPVPFDPRPIFGKVRAPVLVTLSGYTYRSPRSRPHKERRGDRG